MVALAIVNIENTYATTEILETRNGRSFNPLLAPARWDTAPYLVGDDGQRLMEEAGRRVQLAVGKLGIKLDAVALVMPGTIHDSTIVGRSTRLRIMKPLNVTDVMRQLYGYRASVFLDTHCLAIGEASSAALQGHPAVAPGKESFVYILVDEGVGMALFIDGKLQHGAGSAGALGRLVVEPAGEYNRTFAARGPLEVYVARPWLSKHIVSEYLAEQDKTISTSPATPSQFRRLLRAIAEGDRWESLTVAQIASAAAADDHIVSRVIDDAARYLGMALNAVITIVNPPLILIGGSVARGVPGLADSTISYARRLSWGAAWNRTTIQLSHAGREAQTSGAAVLMYQRLTSLP